MKNAKIFMVEDCEDSIKMNIEYLEHFGHTVKLVKKNLEEAAYAIRNFELGGINIAIIDGYFPNRYGDTNIHFNGPIVEKAIKKEYPNIKTIIFSSLIPSKNKYGDVYIWKGNGIKALVEAIENL